MKYFYIFSFVFFIYPIKAKFEFENHVGLPTENLKVNAYQVKLEKCARFIKTRLCRFAVLIVIGVPLSALDLKLRLAVMHRNHPFLAEDFISHLFCTVSPKFFFLLWIFLVFKCIDYIEK